MTRTVHHSDLVQNALDTLSQPNWTLAWRSLARDTEGLRAEDPRLAKDVLVDGTFNVLEAAARAKVRTRSAVVPPAVPVDSATAARPSCTQKYRPKILCATRPTDWAGKAALMAGLKTTGMARKETASAAPSHNTKMAR